MNKISTQVVCVSGKHPMLAPGSTVKPPCVTANPDKDKALQLEPLVNDHPL